MGDGASLFFKNEGPLFLAFFLLISILLNLLIEVSVMIRIQILQKITNANLVLSSAIRSSPRTAR